MKKKIRGHEHRYVYHPNSLYHPQMVYCEICGQPALASLIKRIYPKLLVENTDKKSA